MYASGSQILSQELASQHTVIQDNASEYDELEELTDDEDNPNEFRIMGALDEPVTVQYTTKQLHEMLHNAVIDLEPEYQRGVVWPKAKQISLVDSVFRNYYIPPVVFAVQIVDGEERRICVDGKQRLTSIHLFLDGHIPYITPKTKKKWYYMRPPDQIRTKQEIPDRFKRLFAAKKIACVEYHGLENLLEREIFQRVQLGMALTAAEKLQAISSPWASWIGQLEQTHVAIEGGLSKHLHLDTSRAREFQNIAHLVYCCEQYPERRLPNSQKIEQWLSRLDPPSPLFKDRITKMMNEYVHIATTPGLNDGFRKVASRVAPIEFVFIGVLIYVMMDLDTDSGDRGDAIFRMRQYVRNKFRDIRFNSTVMGAIYNFIDARIVDGGSRSYGSPPKAKRRRRADDDIDYRPSRR